MKDFRGNTYEEEDLDRKCEMCKKVQARRQCCVAEGDVGRTHWHGAVHRLKHGLVSVCDECVKIVNKEWDDRISGKSS